MMDLIILTLKSFTAPPILCFFGGILARFWRSVQIPYQLTLFTTYFLLLVIGMKGGYSLKEHALNSQLFIQTAGLLIIWAFVQTALTFYLVQKISALKRETAAALAASFGSISLMTFLVASSYLETQGVDYQPFLIALLAILEVPGILAGIFLFKMQSRFDFKSLLTALKESMINKPILFLVLGGILGFSQWISVEGTLLGQSFPFFVCLFLFDMGLRLRAQAQQLKALIDLRLFLFGIYMPLLGGIVGLFLSWLLGLDLGTGTLVASLSASASYIAVPATMRLALPQAEESIYMALSLGLVFPFNVIVGTPLYYFLATQFLETI